METREKLLRVRLSDSERDKLRLLALASERTQSDVVRCLLRQATSVHRDLQLQDGGEWRKMAAQN